MLIQFSVSNFLSFDETETLSMIAGKARKNIDRIYKSKKIKLTKCEVILGANASGKSNLVSALQFIQLDYVIYLHQKLDQYLMCHQIAQHIPFCPL